MSEWTEAKAEDSSPSFSPSAMAGAPEPSVYPTAAEPHIGTGEGALPESEQVFHGRPLAVTPSERQRTVQACDKCRERKTKCSGEHPTCQRCATRGLICQYSSREPRTRGPSKARLRNAVSSTELRSPPNPRPYSHGAQSIETDQSPRQPRHFASQPYRAVQDYPILRRVASIPRSFHAGSSPNSIPTNTPSFETAHEAYMQPLRYGSSYEPSVHTQSPVNPQISHWRDVRRVQSHSTLIGSSGGGLSRSAQYSHPTPQPFEDFAGAASYGVWSSQGRFSPQPMAMFDTFERHVPPGASLEPRMPHLQSSKIHPWGYYAEGGNSGSEPIHGAEPNLGYSPSSSEDVPEPSSRCTSSHGVATSSHDPQAFTQANLNFANYTPYASYEPDAGPRSVPPSLNGCAPQFHNNSGLIPDDVAGMMRYAVDADAHAHYQIVGP